MIAFYSLRDYRLSDPSRRDYRGYSPGNFVTKVDLTLRDCARSHFGGCRPLGSGVLSAPRTGRQARSSRCRSRSCARGRRRLTRPTAISIALACVWRCYIAPLSHFSMYRAFVPLSLLPLRLRCLPIISAEIIKDSRWFILYVSKHRWPSVSRKRNLRYLGTLEFSRFNVFKISRDLSLNFKRI